MAWAGCQSFFLIWERMVASHGFLNAGPNAGIPLLTLTKGLTLKRLSNQTKERKLSDTWNKEPFSFPRQKGPSYAGRTPVMFPGRRARSLRSQL